MPAKRKAASSESSTATIGFEAKLWLAADKLRNNMDAAETSGASKTAAGSPKGERGGAHQYKHVVLGLIFLSRAERDRSRDSVTRRASRGLRVKYISDTFEEHRAKLVQGSAGAPPAGSGALAASSSDNPYAGANPEDPDEPSGARQTAAGSPKGERGGANQYKAENVFWVPADARWSHLQANAKQPEGKAEVRMQKEDSNTSLHPSSLSLLTWPDAMVAIERDNPRLKGVLPKDYARPGLDTARRGSALSPRAATPQSLSAAKDNHRLGELIDLRATISLTAASEGEKTHRSVDLLGRVYDWSGATKTAAGSPKGERGGAHQYFLTRFASAEGKNGGVAKCEVRSASGEVKTPQPFVIRNSSFNISPGPACGSGGMSEVRNQNYEGRKRPQGSHQAVCAANHPPVRKSAEIDGGSGAGQATAPLGNIRRSELPGSPSRSEQSRVYREMRRLASGTGGIRVLAGAARRWGNRASGQAAAASCRMRRTHRHLRHDHQESSGLGLTDFLPSSFLLQTLPRLALRGIEADFGPEHADTFRRDLHPDLRADRQMANAEVRMWN